MSQYDFFSTLLLRTPALSYEKYSSSTLKDFLKMAFFRNAIFLASKSFYNQLKKIEFNYDLLDQKAVNTLQKYANRMCLRPTPFGLFSAFSAVEWGDGDRLILGDYKVHLQQGFEEIEKFSNQYNAANSATAQFKANETIYEVGKEYRYLAVSPNDENKSYEFSISSVSNNQFLTQLLKFCQSKRTSIELINYIQTIEDTDATYALEIINELIDLQVLVIADGPNITGRDYYDRIGEVDALQSTLADEKNIDTQHFTSSSTVNSTVDALHLDEFIQDSNPRYVNLEKILHSGNLNKNYKAKILEAIDCMMQLSAAYSENHKLSGFVKAFNQRFEGRTIPLLYVLDPEAGIGYDNLTETTGGQSLISDINWDTNDVENVSFNWSVLHNLFITKGKIGTGDACMIDITDEDLAALKIKQTKLTLPPTVSVMFRIINDNVFIESAGGVSASSLIGRFTPLNSQIGSLSDEIMREEQSNNPEVVFAEIAHICSYHTANINRRLSPYNYEIPVLTHSLATESSQLPLSDLWVSVVDNKVILQSKKTSKRVIPRLSSAFNHSRNNLAIFRFLCDLQYQGINAIWELDLTRFFPDLDFYPRVMYKGSVLQLAKWHIPQIEFQALYDIKNAESRYEAFCKIKQRLKLPNKIAFAVSDNQLIFNLELEKDVLFFLDTVKNIKLITVKEFLAATYSNEVVFDKKDDPFVNQFVTSLYHKQQVFSPYISNLSEPKRNKRSQLPGNDWLYLKIYCHPARANEILADKLFPLTQKLLADKFISNWFFIKYVDPDFHIRFRVKHSKAVADISFNEITNVLNNLVKKKWVSNYQITIYERELERYSIALMEYFENFFYHSSRLTVAYFKITDPKLTYDDFAFITVEHILKALYINGVERVNFLTGVYESFCIEFKADAKMKYELDTKFRTLRKKMSDLLTAEVDLLTTIGLKNEQVGFIDSVKVLNKKMTKKPTRLKLKWAADMIHMHLNRLFIENPRRQEFVVYFLLMKYEKSELAKQQMADKNS